MTKAIFSPIIISLFSCTIISNSLSNNSQLDNRIYIEESGFECFKILSSDSTLWISTSGLGNAHPRERQYKSKFNNGNLTIFKEYEDGEKETVMLKWVKDGDYFLDEEFDLIYRRTKSVLLGGRKYE